MTKKLKISTTLALPRDAVTSTLVVYGGKGTGKTNFASVLVEELAAAHLRFVVIDPMGVWWGIRHDATGKGPGIKVLIIGGIHGDLPIDPTSGAVVADLVADEEASVLVDISRRPDGSMWSIGERVRFVTAFTRRLYQRQGEKRRPIHLVIDEAARFAPQIVRQGETDVAACMGAVAVLVEEGRNVGIGVTLVTQRSARLNKDVAELADCMISFRIVGPNSMRAVLDWLGEHVDKARIKDLGERLRSLPRGSALIISPGWLEYEGISEIRRRQTFDSSKTPEPGKSVRASGKGARPDLEKYRARLAEVVERAQADDPKALKAKVAELTKQLSIKDLKTKATTVIETKEKIVIKEVPMLKASDLKKLTKSRDDVDRTRKALLAASASLVAAIDRLCGASATVASELAKATAPAAGATVRPALPAPRPSLPHAINSTIGRVPPAAKPSPRTAAADDGSLSPMARRMLIALAQHQPAGLTKRKIRVHTGYANSGPVSTTFAHLIEHGLAQDINSRDGKGLGITKSGLAKLGAFDPLPIGDDLRESLLKGTKLSQMERKILAVICGAYPGGMEKSAIREQAGYANSGPVSTAFAHLLGLDYVVQFGRGLAAAPELFG